MKVTNTEFSKNNGEFLSACEKVTRLKGYQNFKPTPRQASKFRNEKGVAYKLINCLFKNRQ